MQLWDGGQLLHCASFGVRGNGCGVISIFHTASDRGVLPQSINSPSELFAAVAAYAGHGGPGEAVFRAIVMGDPSFVDQHVQAVLDATRDWAMHPFGTQLGDFELYRDSYAFAGQMWQTVEMRLVATFLMHPILVRSPHAAQAVTTFFPVTVFNGDVTEVVGGATPIEIFHNNNHFQPITTAAYGALHQPASSADQLLLSLRQHALGSGCAAHIAGSMCGLPLRGGADREGGGGGDVDIDLDDDIVYGEEEEDAEFFGYCDLCDSYSCGGHEIAPISTARFIDFFANQFSDSAAEARSAHTQGSDGWLQARVPLVTASIVGEISGWSSYGTATTVVSGKVAALQDDFSPPAPTVHMLHGSLMERGVMDFVTQHAAQMLSVDSPIIETSPNLQTAPGYGGLGYSADGTVFGSRGGAPFGALIEVKCPSPFGQRRCISKTIPPAHLLQMLFSAHLHNLREPDPARQLKSCFYVVYWRRRIFVTEVPLRRPDGASLSLFGKLGDRAVEAMKIFHRRVLAPVIFMREMRNSVLPKVHLSWEGVSSALQNLKTSAHDARTLVLSAEVLALFKRVREEDDYSVISTLPGEGRKSFLTLIGASALEDSVLAWLSQTRAAIKANPDAGVTSLTSSSPNGGASNSLAARVADLQRAICLSALTHGIALQRGVCFQSLSVRAFGNVALRGALSLQAAFSRSADGKLAWLALEATSVQLSTSPLVILAAENAGSGVASSLLACQQDLWIRIFRQQGDEEKEREVLMRRFSVEDAFAEAQDAAGVRD
jgi:hypothetical protein